VNGNVLTECVQACEQDTKCIAYEVSATKMKGKWTDKCEHFMNDAFESVAKVSRASKSCRKHTVCGSQTFTLAAAVPYPASTPTPTPTDCDPVKEEMKVYKPMDNVVAGCIGNPKKGTKNGKQPCRTVEQTAEACFYRCTKTDKCMRINFWKKDGGCHLVGAGAVGTPSKKVTTISYNTECGA
jgi:hypothetical protein